MTQKDLVKKIMRLYHSRGLERTPDDVRKATRQIMRADNVSQRDALEQLAKVAGTRTHNED